MSSSVSDERHLLQATTGDVMPPLSFDDQPFTACSQPSSSQTYTGADVNVEAGETV